MARQPEYGITGAKLEAVQRPSMLRITLRDVHGRLKPVETDPNEGTVHEAIAHAVELVVQQPEDQCDPGRLGDLLRDRRGQWRGEQNCRIRSQDFGNEWMKRNPLIDEVKKGCVEGEDHGGGNASAPKEGRKKEQWSLALTPVQEPDHGQRYGRQE